MSIHQASLQSQQLSQPKKRRCAEVCVELLATEAVKHFNERQYGPAAPAALEAIGFRVGRQLAERHAMSWFYVLGTQAAVHWITLASSNAPDT